MASEWPGANPLPDTYLDVDASQVSHHSSAGSTIEIALAVVVPCAPAIP